MTLEWHIDSRSHVSSFLKTVIRGALISHTRHLFFLSASQKMAENSSDSDSSCGWTVINHDEVLSPRSFKGASFHVPLILRGSFWCCSFSGHGVISLQRLARPHKGGRVLYPTWLEPVINWFLALHAFTSQVWEISWPGVGWHTSTWAPCSCCIPVLQVSVQCCFSSSGLWRRGSDIGISRGKWSCGAGFRRIHNSGARRRAGRASGWLARWNLQWNAVLYPSKAKGSAASLSPYPRKPLPEKYLGVLQSLGPELQRRALKAS